ncbi:MAG: hypothetical protein EAZ92_15205 [Candidatus Kapaibacterium sp.]|nr:MAG: hypothetical protein EAZ92_15205 [Candidatus Kapabacteria bacterium]
MLLPDEIQNEPENTSAVTSLKNSLPKHLRDIQPPYTVSGVQAQKKNPSRCSVFLNGEFAFGCSMDIVVQAALRVGKTLTAQDVARMMESEDIMRLKQVALRYATYKSRTAQEVRRKMLEKEFSPEEAEYAVQFLEEFGYVNDAAYARAFIKERHERKPSGMERIRQELTKRGISKFEIEDALLEAFPPETRHDTLLESAVQAAHKKLRTLQKHSPEKRHQSLIGYLQRQGFSWEIIRQALKELEKSELDSERNNVASSEDEHWSDV